MDSNFAIIFSAVFISNIVLSQFLGICSFLGVSKSLRNALGMSAAVAFVMVLASLISWLVYYLFLAPYDLTYLNIQKNYTLWQSLLNAVSTAVGYTLALVLFSCIRERLEDSDAPECMKNLPLALITASCMSIAIMGFAGIH